MKYIFILITTLILLTQFASVTYANDDIIKEGGCERAGQCVNNKVCIQDRNQEGQGTLRPGPNICGSSSIGGVRPPNGIAILDAQAGSQQGTTGNIGILFFISNLLRLFTIIAGIWAMFNLIMGGYTYITSMSDSGATEKVKNSITMTVIGLAIMAGAYIIAAVIGALMFGDPNFILQPELQGALSKP